MLTRRSFLQKLGWAVVGSIAVPYIPKTFYSFPVSIEGGIINPELSKAFLLECNHIKLEAYIKEKWVKFYWEEWEDRIINGDPTSTVKPVGILSFNKCIESVT